MKNRIIYIITTVVCLISLFSCNNAERPPIKNLVYLGEAASSKTKDIILQDGVTTVSLTARIAEVTKNDIDVYLKIDTSYLAEYNKLNETSIKPVKLENFTYPHKVVIKAGTVVSEPIKIDIKSFKTNGAQYAIPVVIDLVEGGVEMSNVSSKILVNTIKPLKQKVPKFQWYNGMRATPTENWGLKLSNYTLEWWVRLTGMQNEKEGFNVNNQALIYAGGSGSELYIRFGDLIYSDNSGYRNDFLQIKTMGSQFDTGDPTKGFGLKAAEWMHFAISYDAGTGKSIMYKNGKKVAELGTAKGVTMNIDEFYMISSGQAYFRDYAELCQVRLWKTTRTEVQIQKNMYSEVEYKNKNLILYYPMSEGEGSILHDVTGNGHDVTIGSHYPNEPQEYREKVIWTEYSFGK